MKEVLSNIQAEVLVLARTEDVLLQREQIARAVAEQMGMSGILEETSSTSPLVNDFPEGVSLEVITQRLAEANAKLKERKSQLAPQIRELRTARSSFQVLHHRGTVREPK